MRLGKPLIASQVSAPVVPAPAAPAEPVLLIHGTFSNTRRSRVEGKQWWIDGSDFCQALNTALGQKGSNARTWAGQKEFAWSGENLESSRRQAGRVLAKRIRALEQTTMRYHIIAHSHGGNVVLNALREIKPERLGALIFLGTPCFTFYDAKRRLTTKGVALTVYWTGLLGSLWSAWRWDPRWLFVTLAFTVCLIAAVGVRGSVQADDPWRRRLILTGGALNLATGKINPVLYYGSGRPYAYVFEADEAVHGLKRIADLAEEPRKIFNEFFTGAAQTETIVKPETVERPRTWFDELNDLPHARLLQAFAVDKPLAGQINLPVSPGIVGGPVPSENWMDATIRIAKVWPPLNIGAVAILAGIYGCVALPFIAVALARSVWIGLLRLAQLVLSSLVHAFGPRLTSQYLLHRFYGVDVGHFNKYDSLPPAVEACQPISPDLQAKMHSYSRDVGASLWATGMESTETLALRAQLDKLFDDPTLAHTQYYREPEVIDSIAANLFAHRATGVEWLVDSIKVDSIDPTAH